MERKREKMHMPTYLLFNNIGKFIKYKKGELKRKKVILKLDNSPTFVSR